MTTAPAPAAALVCALAKPKAFFDRIRPLFLGGTINAAQLAGIQCKLDAFGTAGAPLAYVAYGLGTSFWETGQKMQPVREIGRGKGKAYGRPGRNGAQIPYGRGDVQLTWDDNYERADDELGLKGSLIANYDRALETEISARIMVRGMLEGWFTGKKLSSYLPTSGFASAADFRQARRIINGTDRAEEIATIAGTFQNALADGGWARLVPPPRA
ncbi:hypothetical protein [Sphingomonas sp. RIT328]|uniref:hypothetical protein n=1 Tax=Sphingomonas sp. RIT328 TaxID=1470591 RepID=UPI00044A6572|nr:hypothetical protein [Sphingomonas sp. RIT328]EZP57268.1 hypothetical protein BW41_00111 [Sphingomonas sp. RIT328]